MLIRFYAADEKYVILLLLIFIERYILGIPYFTGSFTYYIYSLSLYIIYCDYLEESSYIEVK
ncbi:hypothetical protein J28TS4_58110 [Paenibacillus lautus]|nr:hypothetical protein C172_02220 [Paenibacillus sp. FSL H8-457]GIP07404.1 hypothetical protein J28TS4_58110 [Paenibacillus lautus]